MAHPDASSSHFNATKPRGGLAELLEHALTLKVAFCDLDGTFLDARHEVPAGAEKVIDRLQATGVRFVPATGRTLDAVAELFGPFSRRIDTVACNGMDVTANGASLTHAVIERSLAKELLTLVVDGGLPLGLAVFDTEGAYLLDPDPAFAHAAIESLRGVPDRPLGLGLATNTIRKVAVVVHDRAAEALQLLEGGLGARLDFAPCGPHWIDVLAKGIDKVDGVRMILEHLGAAPHEAVAFGDSMNDLKMMEALPLSAAVANAMPELKQACTFEIGSNADGAVLDCLFRIATLRENAGLG